MADGGYLYLFGRSPDSPEARFLEAWSGKNGFLLQLRGGEARKLKIAELGTSRARYEEDSDLPDLLLFEKVPEAAMRSLLQELRQHQLNVTLKAIVTPTNRDWTVSQLLAELAEEHELMAVWQELVTLTQRADQLLMEPRVLLDEGGFEEAVKRARTLLHRDNPAPITIDSLNDALQGIKNQLSRLGY